MLIIDTHAHIYAEDEKRYPVIPKPNRPPGTSGSVTNLKRNAKAAGVVGVCIVQTSTFYGFDNRFICDTAKAETAWTAGVVTLDPDNPESPALVQDLAKRFDVRAMRSIPGKDGRMDSAGVAALWKGLGRAGMTVNVLANINNTDAIAHMLEWFTKQPVVIDHCLNLKAGANQDAILRDMLRLAKYPNAHAKLTFLATGSAEGYPFRDMHEPCRKIVDAYTPDRCIWGSDFPCELWTPKSTYAQNLEVFRTGLGLSQAAKEAILGKTALRLYFRGKTPTL
jgi:predicted TIM-barrel fold metal-dependent hydrolase